MTTRILICIVYQTTGAAGCRCPSSYPLCGMKQAGWCYKPNGHSHWATTNCGGGFGSSCTASYSSVSPPPPSPSPPPDSSSASSGSPPPPSPSPPPESSSASSGSPPPPSPSPPPDSYNSYNSYNSYDDDDGGGGGMLGGVSTGTVIFFLVVAVGLYCWCKHKSESGDEPDDGNPDPDPDPETGDSTSIDERGPRQGGPQVEAQPYADGVKYLNGKLNDGDYPSKLDGYARKPKQTKNCRRALRKWGKEELEAAGFDPDVLDDYHAGHKNAELNAEGAHDNSIENYMFEDAPANMAHRERPIRPSAMERAGRV